MFVLRNQPSSKGEYEVLFQGMPSTRAQTEKLGLEGKEPGQVQEVLREEACCLLCKAKSRIRSLLGWMKGEWISRDEAALIIMRGKDGTEI